MKSHEFDLMAEQADHWWYEARSALLRDALDRTVSRPDPALRILDLACALGGNYPVLRAYGFPVGLDISPRAVSSSAQRGMAMVQADAQHLPIGRETLDVVVALDVFEHLEDDLAGMRECHRALRPGGRLIFNVPACPALFSRHDTAFNHHRRYTKPEMTRKLEESGFRIDFMSYWSCLLFPAVYVSRKLIPGLVGLAGGRTREGSDFNLTLPGPVAWVMRAQARLELAAMRRGVALPWGVSLYGYARRA